MGLLSDLLYPENPKLRQNVQDLADSIAGDIRFIEKATNDTIERINIFLDVKCDKVDSSGKTVDAFLLDVQRAFEQLGRNAEKQYKQLSATVDTTVIEKVRRNVLGFDLRRMREAVQELQIAGISMEMAVLVVGLAVTTVVTAILTTTVCVAASVIGGILAGGGVGLIVYAVLEAINGAMERKELERRVRELEKAEKTIRDNRNAIVDCAERLREALIVIRVMAAS